MTDKNRTISPLSGNRNLNNNSDDYRADATRALLLRGINRKEASCYIGISPSLFDELVKDGRMPKPFRINTRVLWDLKLLEKAFDFLSKQEVHAVNPWDED